MLAGNQLTDLPPSLAQCQNLELIRIASNRLATAAMAAVPAEPDLAGLRRQPGGNGRAGKQ